MSGYQITGTHTNGIALTNSATQNPATIVTSAYVTNTSGDAVLGYNYAWTVSNYGTINATFFGADGIQLENGGLVTNVATIDGSGTGVAIAGAVRGTVVNSGVIVGSSVAGVQLLDGGLVTNAAGGSISGAEGVYGGRQAITVSNSGIIAGSEGAGVVLKAGGTVVDAGTIVGASGTAVYLGGAGSDRLVLDPGYGLGGAVIGSPVAGGTNTLELGSGTSDGTLTGLGTKFSDFAAVAVDAGAQWTLAGSNTIASSVTLTDYGTLANGGTFNIAGSLIVDPASLTNSGIISGTVTLADGSDLDNTATGTIAAASIVMTAVYGTTSRNTVVNAGTILGGSFRGAAGVDLASGGVLTNSGGGLLYGGSYGANLGGIGTVVNAGTITAGYDAVLVAQGTVDNTGTLTGDTGLFMEQNGAVTNAGLIDGSDTGVFLDGLATLTNQGSIVGGNGVDMFSAPGTIINSGGIIGTFGASIYTRYGGAVTNYGTIAGGLDGIAAGGGVVLDNAAGLIAGSYAGVELAGGATIVNVGTIEETGGPSYPGVAVRIGSGGTVVDSGTITAASGTAVAFYGAGDNLVVLEPGYQLGGVVIGSTAAGASNTLEFGAGAAAGTLSGLGTEFINFGTITVAPGVQWTLAGGTIGADVTLTDYGTLSNIGSLYVATGGRLIVDPATFANSGYLYGAVTLAGGSYLDNTATGTIVHGGNAVYGTAAANTVGNFGTIVSTDAAAVDLVYGGSVNNASGGTISGNLAGVYITAGAATVANSGTITGQTGIDLGNGGTVTNAAGGLIAGSGRAGIDFRNGPGTVSNYGTIASTYGDAIDFSVDAGVGNASAGVIAGYDDGIDVSSQAGTVINAGTIVGDNGEGVFISYGGYVGNATGGTILGYSVGVYVGGTAATISNSGTIAATGEYSTGVKLANGGYADNRPGGVIAGYYGIYIGAATGAVSNSGLIRGNRSVVDLWDGGVIANYGTIGAAFGYAVILGDPGTVTNSGLIAGEYNVVSLYSGGNVSNTGTISAGNDDAVYLVGVGTVSNNGLIDGGDYVVELADGGVVSNSGTIIGRAGFGVYLDDGGTVVNAGTIVGICGDAVYFAAPGQLIVDPGAVFSGTVDGGDGGSVLELAAGATSGALAGFGTSVINFTTIAVDAGAVWSLAGTLGAGTTFVNPGTVAIPAGATLALYGAVYGGGDIDFTAPDERLALGSAAIPNTISGFAGDDGIDFTAFTYSSGNTATYDAASHTLTVSGGANSDTLSAYGIPLGTRLAAISDHHGGTLVEAVAASGYRIYGVHTAGIVLNVPTTQNPAVVAPGAYITNTSEAYSGDAVYGNDATAWTLTNYGTLYATQDGGNGVFFAAGGAVTNQGVGRIGGPDAGITISGSSGTVINVGTVSGGVVLNAGGTVTNGAAAALITGYNGVYVNGGAGTVNNLGTISGIGDFATGIDLASGGSVYNQRGGVIYGSAYGVSLASGGNVTNALGGYIDGDEFAGVAASGAAATVSNSGTITGWYGISLGYGGSVTNTAAATLIYGYYVGVSIDDKAGAVANYGTIVGYCGDGVFLGYGGAVTNNATAALIYGYDGGVDITGADGTVSNLGTIASTGEAANAVMLGYGGYVANASGGLIAGWDGYGISIDGFGSVSNAAGGVITGAYSAIGIFAAGTVANSGTIVGYDRGGILLASGGGVTNTATGLIQGASYGVDIVNQPGTVANYGMITGSSADGVLLGAGGSVSNVSVGVIAGYNGIYIGEGDGAGAGVVTNSGTVLATADYGTAIWLADGGSVSNASNGLVSGVYGIFVQGAAGTVTNNGTVGGLDYVVELDAGGVVANYGTISASGFAAVILDDGTVANEGLIIGYSEVVVLDGDGFVSNGADAVISATAAGGIGIALDADGTVINAGTIAANAGTAVYFGSDALLVADPGAAFYGLVDGGRGGDGTLELASGAGAGTLTGLGTSIVNFGTVTVDDGAQWTLAGYNLLGSGVILTDLGTLTGSGTLTNAGTLIAAGASLIVDPATMINRGYISGTVTLAGGSYLDNTATGTIVAAGTAVYGTASPNTVVNAGTIAGGGDGIDFVAGGAITNLSGGAIAGSDGLVVSGGLGVVSNSGAITGTAGGGVYLKDGGSVSNASGGSISGEGGGIAVENQAGTVENSGTITGGNGGIYLTAGGLVTNGTRGSSAGLIRGGDNGVGALNVPGTVINYGTIVGGALNAIYLRGGNAVNYGTLIGHNQAILIRGAAGTVTNSGAIGGGAKYGVQLYAGGGVGNSSGGIITANYLGVYIAGGPGTVTNAGVIDETAATGGRFDAAVAVRADGYVVNSGTLQGETGIQFIFTYGTVDNTGTVLGSFGGVLINGAAEVLNAGLISATNKAAYLTGGGYLINDGGALIAGPTAVFMSNDAGTVINAGTLDGTGPSGVGADLTAGGTVVDFGTIIGGSGTAVSFGGSGDNLLALAPDYSLGGGAAVGSSDASNALELLPEEAVGTLAGLGVSFQNFGTIVVDPTAAWQVTGANTLGVGVTLSDAGTLAFTGSLYNAGVLDISSGATLGLYGAVGGEGGDIDFVAPGGRLVISAATIPNAISGFAAGDTIDLPDISANAISYSDGIVTLSNATTVVAQLSVSTPYSNPGFTEARDSTGGTEITVSPPVAGDLTYVTNFTKSGLIQTDLIKEFPSGVVTGNEDLTVPFDVVSDANGNNFDAITGSLTINVSIPDVSNVYTLMNAYHPPSGQDAATVEFFGSDGAIQTFTLVYGTDLRDFFDGSYADTINGTTTQNAFTVTDVQDAGGTGNVDTGSVGTYVIDEQDFVLDPAFASQTLTQIVITNINADGTPILLGVTALTASPSSAYTITGSNFGGIVLSNPTTQNPTTIASGAYVTNTTPAHGGDALYGTGTTAWTISNYGTLNATQPGSDGVFLAAGGTVTNASSGYIGGPDPGIVITGSAGTVTNSGTITGGVALEAGGSVYNNAATALITGTEYGVNVTGGVGTITNYGTIGSTNPTAGAGVTLASGGAVTNGSDDATLALIYGDYGVDASGGPTTLTNLGTIAGSFEGADVTAGGLITNGAADATAALITGPFVGLSALGGASVVNYGIIQGAAGGGFGVLLFPGGSLINEESGLVTGSTDGDAVNADDAPATVVNFGTIADTGAGGQAVSLTAGGDVVNGSGETPFGLIVGAGGVTISGAAGTVANYGTIVGMTPGDGGVGRGVDLGAGGTLYNSGLIATYGALGVFAVGAPGTVVNAGTIVADPGGGYIYFGVYLKSGGQLTNLAGGQIYGYPGGVAIAGAPATVTNYGTIWSTGTLDLGTVYLTDGGFVGNGSGDFPAAQIAGYAEGVEITGGVGTLVNYGTVLVTGVDGIAADLKAGGTVANAAGGVISGAAAGVAVQGFSGAVTNAGLITAVDRGVWLAAGGGIVNSGAIAATGASGEGVYLGQGGNLTNASTGTISADTNGVAAHGAAATIVNFGTIAHLGYGASGEAVYFAAGGTLTNYGLISGARPGSTSTGYPGAAEAHNVRATVINFGTITNPNNSDGVNLNAGGVLVNGPDDSASATISAVQKGVYIGGTLGVPTPGAVGTVVNYGTIASTGGTGPGVLLAAGGTALNFGLVASAETGISFIDTAGTVDNLATIISTAPLSAAAGAGVYLGNGGDITNAAGGLVEAVRAAISLDRNGTATTNAIISNFGTLIGATGIVIATDGSTADNTIVNYGTIVGTAGTAVQFGADGDELVIEAGSTLVGVVANVHGGDAFDLPFLTYSPGGTATVADGVLHVVETSGTFNIDLNPNPNLYTDTFTVEHDSSTGSLIEVAQHGTIYSGTYTSGIVLSNPATQLPTTIAATGYVTNTTTAHGGDAVFGTNAAAWTLSNLGTITGTTGDAVYFAAGGLLTNYGLISGARVGVPGTIAGTSGYSGAIDVHNQRATVVNFGTITNPNNSNGVNLLAGGLLVNGSPEDTAALIAAPHGGVYMGGTLGTPTPGAVGTAVNYGTIASGSEQAIFLAAAGTVVNDGTILDASKNSAVFVDYGLGVVANSGAIANADGAGVHVARGVVVNQSDGLIVGGSAGDGVLIGTPGTGQTYAGAGTLTNFGTIESVGVTAGAGAYLGRGGLVSNQSLGLITAYRDAVSLGGVHGGVANYGTIASTGASFAGVGMAAGGSVANSGLILGGAAGVAIAGGAGSVGNFGTIEATDGIGVVLAAGGSTLVNAGIIVGASGTAVSLAGDGNHLVIDPGAVFAGYIDGGGGTDDVVELTAGMGGAIGTIANHGLDLHNFTGSNLIEVDAGADWVVSASGTIPLTTLVDNGALSFANTITNYGEIDIGASARLALAAGLGGDGTIEFTGADGTLAIGGSTMPQNAIGGFALGDTIDLEGLPFTSGVLSASFNESTGTLSVTSGGTVVDELTMAGIAGGTQFAVTSDTTGGGGSDVTIASAPVTELFDFIFTYTGGTDYYEGTVADNGSFGYYVGETIATAAGSYDITADGGPAPASQPAGTVFVSAYYHDGPGELSPVPVDFLANAPDSSSGLLNVADSVMGLDGNPHPFSPTSAANFGAAPLYGFTYRYTDGREFYSGTVADDGSGTFVFGLTAAALIADGGTYTQTVTDAAGNVVGSYTIFADGLTSQAPGTVTIDSFTDSFASGLGAASYIPNNGDSAGSNGLGSEIGTLVIAGTSYAFSDQQELDDLPANAVVTAPPGDASLSAQPGLATLFDFDNIAFGQDTIAGFSSTLDAVQLSTAQAADFAALDISGDGNGGSLITFGAGQSIDLAGVAPGSLSSSDFVFIDPPSLDLPVTAPPVLPADFTGSGGESLLWRNATSGDTELWNFAPGTTDTFTADDLGVVSSAWTIEAAADFTGAGKADILWRNSNGNMYLWNADPGTGTVAFTGQDLGPVTADWVVQGTGDFTGAGSADILWRNVASGDTYLWNSTPNAGGTASFVGQDLGIVSRDWTIVAVADFTGSGADDILWRNSATGDVYLWDSTPGAGGTAASFTGQDLGVVSSDWTVLAAVDFTSDGKAGILWQNTASGDVYLWNANPGSALTFTGQDLGILSADWSFLAAGDLGGSGGDADIVWRNVSNGEVSVWTGDPPVSVAGQDLGVVSADWTIAAAGDFNGTLADGILWRNTASGDADLWNADPSGGSASFTGQNLGAVSADWVVAGTGNFTGSGTAGILWRNVASGDTYLWNSTTAGAATTASFVGQDLGIVTAEWSVAGTGDFTGSGRDDILWRNGATGDAYLWNADSDGGTASFTGQDLGPVTADWSVAGTGDFTGSGRDDILWRNGATGDVYLWDANPPTSTASASFSGQDLGVVSAAWTIEGVGDFTGAGTADILWENASSGEVGLWASAPASSAAASSPVAFTFEDLGTVTPDWKIQQVGDFTGDGLTGILWRNTATGDTYLWNSTAGALTFTSQNVATQPLNWQL